MRSPNQLKPPFHARNESDRVAMKEYVLGRLYEDDVLNDDRDLELLRLLPGIDAYATAKAAARNGNLKPLAKILSAAMDDPGLVAFLAVPPRCRGKPSCPFKRFARRGVIDTVRRIHTIWRQDFGQKKRDRRNDDSAEKIAAEIYGLSEHAVRQIMKKAAPLPKRRRRT
jgi:hypothetical protein